MLFDYDFYISFSKADNLIPGQNNRGWVSNFQKFTEILITQLQGQKPVSLFIASGEQPSEDQLAKCAAMICIVSPDYVKDAGCLEDVETFYQLSIKSGLEPRERIYKVVKFPVAAGEEPIRLQGLLPYPLFEEDTRTGDFHEIQDFLTRDSNKEYWMKLTDFAYDLHEVVKSNRPAVRKETSIFKDKKYIYLAETGPDLIVQRSIIKRELLRLGFQILPEEILPSGKSEAEAIIKKKIESSLLSIHMVGAHPGRKIKDTEEGIVELQNRVGCSHSESKLNETAELGRLIWIEDGVQPLDSKQKKFIDSLRKDAELSVGAEVMELPLEDFKLNLKERLKAILGQEEDQQTLNKKSKSSGKSSKAVYLIYDKIDEGQANKLTLDLEKKGITVLKPDFEHGFTDMRGSHIHHLCESDAFLILKDKINDRWVQMKALDTLKAPGLGRTKPPAIKCILNMTSQPLQIKDLQQYDIPVIESLNTAENELDIFLDRLTR